MRCSALVAGWALLLCGTTTPAAAQGGDLAGAAVVRAYAGVVSPSTTFDRATDISGAGMFGVSLTSWQHDYLAIRMDIGRTLGRVEPSRPIARFEGESPSIWFANFGLVGRIPVSFMNDRLFPYLTAGFGPNLYTHKAETADDFFAISGNAGAGLQWQFGRYGVAAEVIHWIGADVTGEGGRISHLVYSAGVTIPIE